nr:MAG TPA: hypothetical protein [Caudoviricetes sp.]
MREFSEAAEQTKEENDRIKKQIEAARRAGGGRRKR